MLIHVSRPLIDLRPLASESFPELLTAGATIRCRPYLFGFLPQGVRELFLERVDDETGEIQTREHDPLIRRWDHLLRVVPLGRNCCRYSDTVEIEAGVLTPFIWLFARLFYRHRHRRWRAWARQSDAR